MARKPGRLYRKLDWLPKPIFAVQTPNIGTITDDNIQSITIHRGKSGAGGGVHPSTVEVRLANNLVAKAGEKISVVIRNAANTALAAKWTSDPNTPAYIRDRFTGRVGKQSMEDRGNKKLPLNTIMGASWSAQLSYSPEVHTLPSGTSVEILLARILRPAYLASRYSVNSYGQFDATFGDVSGKYSDLIGKFAGDIGILCRDRRDGSIDILPMAYRRDLALAGIPTAPSMTRSQAISPAQWDQPNETPAIEYRLTYRDANNVVQTIVTSPTGAVTGTAPVEDLDWTYFRAYTDQWRYIHGLRSQSFDDRFRLESVTVDLLHLLSSPYTNHWAQAGRLIGMQVGDPVYFSQDWPTPLQGVHFAEGITETINSDTWEITLNLVRFRELTGEEPITPVPARVWDQARYPWDTETRKWNEA